MSFKISNPKISETLAQYIKGYEKIISEFKASNPQRYVNLKQSKQAIFKDVMKNAFDH